MRALERQLRSLTLASLALVLSPLGCASLPDVPTGVCGNAIVEPKFDEDCDGYAPEGQSCRPASAAVGACRFDCFEPFTCPTGYACGADGLCRRGTGTYRPWHSEVATSASRLLVGDFDGDRRDELVALGSPAFSSSALPKIFFFDYEGNPRDVFDPKIAVNSPSVTVLGKSDSSQSRQSLIFGTEHGIASLSASDSRIVLSDPYPYQALIDGGEYRVVPIPGVTSTPLKTGIMGLLGNSSRTTVFGANGGTTFAQLEMPIEQLLSNFESADVDTRTESPCAEFLYAQKSDRSVYLIQPCDKRGEWKTSVESPQLVASLPEGSVVTRPPLTARVNEDKHLDLVLSGPNDAIYVAFGLGDGRFASDLSRVQESLGQTRKLRIRSDLCPDWLTFEGFPLAIGDLNSDSRHDWVGPNGVFLITETGLTQSSSGDLELSACSSNCPFVRKWSLAHLDDFNRDGKLDLIAASADEPDVEFFLGTGNDQLNPFTIATSGTVRHLESGDFDGDLTKDLALVVEARDSNATSFAESPTETVYIAFGTLDGAPEQIREVGRFRNVRELRAAVYAATDAIEELGIISQRSQQSGDEIGLFIGNTGRQPIAPMGLSQMTPDGEGYSGFPLAVATGKFDNSGLVSAIAFGIEPEEDPKNPASLRPRYRLWWCTGSQDALLETPRVSRKLSEDFNPINSSDELAVYLISGDLNDDRVDDLGILAAGSKPNTISLWPTKMDGAKFSSDPDSDDNASNDLLSPPQSTTGTLLPNSNPTLLDLDRDGYLDLAFLATHVQGDSDNSNHLMVAWNNKKGALGFPEKLVTLDPTIDSPLSLYGTSSNNGDRLFIATASKTVELSLGKQTRQRFETRVLSEVGGQAIAVGDLTGDGLLDLVLGTSAGFRVFAEVAERP